MSAEACTKVKLCCRKAAASLTVIEDEADDRSERANNKVAAILDAAMKEAEAEILRDRRRQDATD